MVRQNDIDGGAKNLYIIITVLLSLLTFSLGFGISQLAVVSEVSAHSVEIKNLNDFKSGHSTEHVELLKSINQLIIRLDSRR